MFPTFMRIPLIVETPTRITDPLTGDAVDGPPTIEMTDRGYIEAAPVAQVGWQTEMLATQQTVQSLSTVMVPPEVAITAGSTVIDPRDGSRHKVVGKPAIRRNLAGEHNFTSCAVRWISDMQGVT
ncbi:hypothetical protein [Actinoalloteichus sp. GBA129-24]|uniref:hypothetical protein n=1 Tax=Actinoalloteichus sp. GBA129-24 TaxID=1612551 RepID=UPI000950A35C|nr:hypothetical protein [Actinoalloteichus sp. GBA129-24]APU20946.1 hypothetical protein UA75_14680 [Actinoalloteichus sp. GBA129-24]APU24195.1 hypothetical protein UA75_31160 [Actinoalloteichus sp. GBA129-24]